MPRVAVVSDTHVPTRAPHVPPRLLDALRDWEPDTILHAGDLVVPDVLELFEAITAVHAVQGNMDRFDLPATYTGRFDGVGIAMRHKPRSDTSLHTFGEANDAAIVIHGHTHIARHEERSGMHILNPGSPTQPRSGDPSYATIRVEDGTPRIRIHTL